MNEKLLKVMAAMTALGLVAGACGTGGTERADVSGVVQTMLADQTGPGVSGADDELDPVPTVDGVDDGAPAPAAPGTGPIDAWGQVTSGVVQILAEGDRVELDELGLFELPDLGSSGTGFFIDPDGVIVTNNHVVTGAASVQVLLPGESRARNARVLGASECWDLAAIELVDGGTHPYFEWADAEPAVATEVYAVGFPLGDPEVTVTKGVVSKASADAQTDFASVDDSLETDADINGGNSGGPLVTENGEVVGINFAGNDFRQGFAIKAAAAKRVIERLRAGEDVDSIGLNAQAVTAAQPGGFPLGASGGLFVHSVETGSDAFNAGVRAGEVIIRVEGTNVAEDGLMTEYCDILRTRGNDRDLTLVAWDPISGTVRELLVSRGE